MGVRQEYEFGSRIIRREAIRNLGKTTMSALPIFETKE